MNKSANVLPFNARGAASGHTVTDMPPLLNQARARAEKQLQPLFSTLFDKADDALFDLANKAENNTQQAEYFDVMREMRLRRNLVLETFAGQYLNEFSASLQGSRSALPDEPLSLELALIDNSDLEISIAIRNMAEKARDWYADALYCLHQRTQAVVKGGAAVENPFDPVVLCEAYRAALELVSMPLTARLVIYKLFDKIIIQNLEPVYAAANTALIEGGVLPDLQGKPRHSSVVQVSRGGGACRPAGAAPAAAGGDSAELSAQQIETFTLLQQLLAQQRELGNVTPVAAIDTKHALSTGEMLSTLSGLQLQFQAAPSVADGSTSLRTQLQQTLQSQDGGKEVSQNHADTIDVVGMMFDFILDDPELPGAVKGLIARLQIPMLKVALLDREFFGRKSHPARALLNALAQAGQELDGVESIQSNPVFVKIEQIINRILHEFDDSLELFDELLQQLQETEIEQHDQEQVLLAQIQEKMEQSRSQAHAAIAPLLAAEVMPDAVKSVLAGAWTGYLTDVYRDTEDSSREEAERVLKLAATLVDSIQPKADAAGRRGLTLLLPSLLVDLQRSPVLTRLEVDEKQRFFKAMEDCHLNSLRGKDPAPEPSVPPVQQQAAPVQARKPEAAPAAGGFGLLFQDLPLPASSRPKPVAEPPAAPTKEIPPVAEEIVLSSSPEGRQDDRQWGAEYSAHAHTAREMQIGTWLNLIDEQGDSERVKLAWKSDDSSEFAFADRLYNVVKNLNLQQLITALAEARIVPVEEKPLMDRALDSVMSALKKYRDKVDEQTAPDIHPNQ